jgi:hypothetical protein
MSSVKYLIPHSLILHHYSANTFEKFLTSNNLHQYLSKLEQFPQSHTLDALYTPWPSHTAPDLVPFASALKPIASDPNLAHSDNLYYL